MIKRWGAALVAMVVVAAGCGGNDGGTTTVELVQGAGAAVIEQETARLEMRFEGAGQSFDMDGQIDFVNNASSISMDIPMLGAVDMVSSGSDMYVRTEGDAWIKIVLTGDVAEQATGGFGADPRQMLEQLADADGITEEGTEEIRGVRTTRYTGRLDIEKAMRAQGVSEDQIDMIYGQLGEDAEVTATVDVFIADDGLAHRTIARTEFGDLMTMTVTMDLLDFGEPVDIRVPSDDEVERTETASTQAELNAVTQSIFLGG